LTGLVSLGALIALAGLYANYKYSGADELRSKFYQPLYREVAQIEKFVESGTASEPFPTEVLKLLKDTGGAERLPRALWRETEAAYGKAGELSGCIHTLTERIQRLVSARIVQLRTKEIDAEWRRNAVELLQKDLASKEGVSSVREFTFRHAARGPGMDVRDPGNPKISDPGGPTWQINDWLGFPESAASMEQLWTNRQFLYFDDQRDDWYYRITRSDLQRHGTPLLAFLGPIRGKLDTIPEFQRLQQQRSTVLAQVRTLKTKIADRVREPKRVVDLLE
jgi:hypothetical protein